MVKRLFPWLRVLLIVMSLVLGQVQMIVTQAAAVSVVEEPAAETAVESDSSTGVSAPAPETGLLPPLQSVNECMIAVGGFAILSAPSSPTFQQSFWGTTTDPALYYGAGNRGSATDFHVVGDAVKFFVGVGNSSSSCSAGAETINNVAATVTISGTGSGGGPSFSTTAAFTWPNPSQPKVLQAGETAWFVFDYILPSSLSGDVHINVDATAVGATTTNNARDFDDSYVRIEGPGFSVVSFAPVPGDENAPPGSAVDFVLIIQNSRPGTTITDITVASSNGQFVSQCNGIGNWTDLSVPSNPIGTLTYPNQAQCQVTNVLIPSDPAPETFSLSGDLTVSDGSNSMTTNVKSSSVNVSLPDMAVRKKVVRIDRGLDIIYNGTPPVPQVAPGDLVTYQIEIENTGEIALVDLFIVDSLTGPQPVGGSTSIVPGATFVLQTSHQVVPGGQDPLTNTVNVEARGEGTTDIVTGQAATSVDVVDSVLKVFLTVEDPVTGAEIESVDRGQTVRYRLLMFNEGNTTLTNIAYVPLSYPLNTVGNEPAITTTSLTPGTWSPPLTWEYTIASDDPDPLLSTVRIRARNSENVLIYGQDNAELNISSPDIEISNIVLEPETATVLRGGQVVYEVTVTNKNDVNPVCNVVVDQYLRDPDTAIETLVQAGINLVWPDPGQPGRIGPLNLADPDANKAVGTIIYLVTGETKDPLEMIFEVRAQDGCPGSNELTDRSTRVLDLSDVQINTQILPNFGADGIATVGENLPLVFIAQNVGAVSLENLSATYCILPHQFDNALCDVPFNVRNAQDNSTTIASFEDATGTFNYTIQPGDETISPFIIEVTLFGTDNKGNTVSITTAYDLPIATDQLEVQLVGPGAAVVGDEEIFGYQIWNRTGVNLTNVTVYNLLEPDGSNVIATYETLFGAPDEVFSLQDIFNQIIFQTSQTEENPVMTMRIRVEATRSDTSEVIVANAKVDVVLIPMISVLKEPSASLGIAGQPVSYTIRITNNARDQTLTLTQVEDAVFDYYGISYSISQFNGGLLDPQAWAEVDYTIPAVDPLPNPLVNNFLVEGTRSYDNGPVYGSGTAVVELECPIAVQFDVVNLDAPDADYVLGERLEWHISLLNVSSARVQNIQVTESLNWGGQVPQDQINWGVGNPMGVLDPNEFAYLPTFDKLITSDYYNASGNARMVSDVVISFTDENNNGFTCDDVKEIPLFSPVWALKTADPVVAFVGETVTYTFGLRNVTESDDAPYDVYYIRTMTDSLLTPAGIRCDFNQDNTIDADELSGFIGPGEEIQCETRTRNVQESDLAEDQEELVNTVRVEFPDPGSPDITFFTTTSATVLISNPLVVTKTASVSEAVAGDSIFYDFTLSNTSPYPITGITLVDDKIGDIIPTLNGGSTLDLAPSQTFALDNVSYTIPIDSGDPLVNVATATGNVQFPVPQPGGGTIIEAREVSTSVIETVDLLDSDLTVTKLAYADDNGNPGNPLPDNLPVTGSDGVQEALSGAPVHYCFTVTNTNPGPLTYIENITVRDAMFPNVLQTLFESAVGTKYSGQPSNQLYGTQFVEFCQGPITLNTALGDPVENTVVVEGDSPTGGQGGTPLHILTQYSMLVDLLGQDLRVSKVPSQTLAFIGDEVTYTIVIEDVNQTHAIHDIEVMDFFGSGAPVPLPMDLFDWSLSGISGNPVGQLDVGGRATYSYTYTIQPTDPVTLSNTAVASGVLQDTDLTVVEDSTRTSVAVTSSQLLVQKSASTDTAEPGDEVSYIVTIKNVGNTPVKNIMAVDRYHGVEDVYQGALATGGSLSDIDLDPYESADLTFTLTMPTGAELSTTPEKDPFLNEIAVYGTVFDDDGNPVPHPNPGNDPYLNGTTASYSIRSTDTETVDIINPDLRVFKDAQVDAATAGQTIPYTVWVRNDGQDTLTNIVINDLVAGGGSINLDTICPADPACIWTYTAEPPGDYDNNASTPLTGNPKAGEKYDPNYTNPTYPMLVGGLGAGEKVVGQIDVTIPVDYTGTQFTNIVEATASSVSASVSDRASDTIDIREAGINVSKSASTSLVPVGSPVDYTLTITNVGGITFNRVVITDKGVDPGDLDGNSDPNTLIITSGFPDSPEEVIAGDDTATFDADEQLVITYTYTITGTDADPYVNRATVRAVNTTTGASALNVAQAIVDVQGTEVSIEKYVCADDPAPAAPPAPTGCGTVVNVGDATPDVLTYYLHIVNTGSVALENLTVSDTLVPGTTFDAIVWPQPNNGLAPYDGTANSGDDEVWFTYTYTVQPGDQNPLLNIATVTGDAQTVPVVTVEDASSASATLVTGDLQLTKSAVNSATVGATVQYVFTVENLSSTDEITNVEVFDPLLSQSSAPVCSPGTLAAGATFTCPAVDRVIGLGDPRPFVNTATATGLQNSVTVNATATHTLEIVTAANVSVTKTASVGVANVGDVVTYVYEIANNGTAPINSLSVVESDASVMADANWSWPTVLPAGSSETVTIQRTITATDPDPYVNTVTVTGTISNQPILVEATETVFIANGSLVVENTPSTQYAIPGQNVTFIYRIRNLGSEDLTITSATDDLCTVGDATALMTQIEAQLSPPAVLAAGNNVTVYCTQPAAAPGPLASLLRVEATETNVGAISDTAYAEVEVTSGGVLVVKNADRTIAQVGDTITYTIDVTNVGTETLENIVFSDATITNPLPAPPASLPEGQSFTITGTYTVQAGDTSVSNTAVVTATGALTSNVYEDLDTAVVAVVESGDTLALTKSTTTTLTQPGQPVSYRLTVRNVSNAEVTNITLQDGAWSTIIPSLQPNNVYSVNYIGFVPSSHQQSTYTNTAQALVSSAVVDEASATIDIQLVSIAKAADVTSVAPGGTITYTYTLSSLSFPNGIPNVTVTDSMETDPDFSSSFTWTTAPPSSVPAFGTTAEAQVTVPLSYAGSTVNNTVEIAVDGIVVDTDTVSVPVVAPVPAVSVDVTQTAPVPPNPPVNGSNVTYTIAITNTGNVPVSGLTGVYTITPLGGTQTTPVNLTFDVTSLLIGEVATATVTKTEDQTTQYTFTAAVTFAEQGASDPPVEGSLVITPTVPSGVLQAEILTVTQDVPQGAPVANGMTGDPMQTGEDIVMTARLTNTGVAQLLVDPPTAAINVSSGGTCQLSITSTQTGQTAQWPGILAAGQSTDDLNLRLTFTCNLFQGLPAYRTSGGLNRTLTLTANSATGVATDTQAITLVDLMLDAQLAILDATGNVITQADQGDQIKFRVTLSNLGASRIGCTNAEAPVTNPSCRLTLSNAGVQLATSGTSATLSAAFQSALNGATTSASVTVGSTVLQPMGNQNASAVFETPLMTFSAAENATFAFTAMGGYYAQAIYQSNPALLAEYTTLDNTSAALTFVGGGASDLTLSVMVNPNPPVYGAAVQYIVTVANPANGTPVTGLTGTYTITPTGVMEPQDGILLVGRRQQQQITGQLTFNTTDVAPGLTVTANPIARIESFASTYIFTATITVDQMAQDETQSVNVSITPVTSGSLTPTPQGGAGAATGDPTVEKSASAETAQAGGVVNWSVVVRNDTSGPMDAVTLQDSVPESLTISGATVNAGSVRVEGQLITVNIGGLAAGESATLSVSTTVRQDVEAPADITNTACALRVGGTQVCDTASVTLGPGVATLPLTGQRIVPTSGSLSALGMIGLVLLGLFALMMTAQINDRRMLLAAAVLLVVLVVLVVVVMLAMLGGDEDSKPADEAGVPASPVGDGGGVDVAPPVATQGPSEQVSLFEFPPTPTPYVMPTPAGLRYLKIPKLGDQFSVPVPIVQLPIVNREWDVSGLGQYIGWLEGTTWLDSHWGNTVLAAHVQLGTDNPGPFWGLSELEVGDEIVVLEGDSERTYVVQSKNQVDPNDWTVTAPTTNPTLTLITCTEWDESFGIFAQRMVVQAVPAS